MFTYVFVVLATLLAIFYFYEFKKQNLPPGPFYRLPILGHLPFLGDNPSATLLQWSKIFGPILHVYLGSFEAIVINDSQLIKKAFNLNTFVGRPHNKLLDKISGDRRGFSFTD
ncbi:unnamed protein product, partial [Allacma fusca]